MGLVVRAGVVGVLVGLLSAGAGELAFREAGIGSEAARLGAALLLGAPLVGLAAALRVAVLGWLLARQAGRRAAARTGRGAARG